MTEDAFLAVVTAGQPSAPEYFVYNAVLNRQQRDIRDLDVTVPALSADEVDAALAAGAAVHDARDPQEFAAAHLEGAVNVPVDGRMAETVGMVFSPEQSIVVIAPEGQEQEVATRFARIGYDHVLGYVADPEAYFLGHADSVRHASRLTVAEAAEAFAGGDVQVVDIRNAGEVEAGMVPGARHIPLAELGRRVDELDVTRPVVVYCAGGWRSSVGGEPAAQQGLRRRLRRARRLRRLGAGARPRLTVPRRTPRLDPTDPAAGSVRSGAWARPSAAEECRQVQ